MEQKEIKIEYLLYARKSSEQEDRQVLSIDSQLSELNSLAKNNGIEITDTLTESYSAKGPGRAIFNSMLEKIEKGEANAILAWHPNRLSRNSIDTGRIIYLMDQGKLLEVRTPGQVFRHDNPNDKFLLSLLCSQAKLENDNKGIDVKRGLKRKAERGMFPGPAPTGYRNDKYAERGNKKVKPDTKLFKLIRQMWDLMLTGNYTVMDILRTANEEWGYKGPEGKPLGRSTLYSIFTKTFYYGEFEYPAGSGNWYKGDHKPMITAEEYDEVQILLGRKGRPRPKKHMFTYTGMLKCGECGASITAEKKIKRQKNGNVHHYIYYHCTKRINPDCSQGSVEIKELKKQINKLIDGVEVYPEFDSFGRKWFREVFHKEAEDRNTVLKSQQRALSASISKLDRLIDMRAAGEITAQEFAQKKNPLLKEKKRVEELLSDTGNRVDEWVETSDNMITLLELAHEKLKRGTRQEKRELLAGLGSNLTIYDKELRIELDNILFPMKKVSAELKTIHKMFEPAKNSLNKKEIELLYARNPRLLRALDEVRTAIMQNINGPKFAFVKNW